MHVCQHEHVYMKALCGHVYRKACVYVSLYACVHVTIHSSSPEDVLFDLHNVAGENEFASIFKSGFLHELAKLL